MRPLRLAVITMQLGWMTPSRTTGEHCCWIRLTMFFATTQRFA